MKKKLFQSCAASVLSLAFLCAAGCAGQPEKEVPSREDWQAVIEGYRSEEGIMIGAWGNPEHTYEAYKNAAEMGLTHIFLGSDAGSLVPGESEGSGSEDMENLQTWFTELGLKAIWQTGVAAGSATAGTFNDNLRHYSCIEGVNSYDEPRLSAMDMLKEAVRAFDEEYGDELLCFTNVWPSSGGNNIGGTYSEYLNKYKEVIEQIKRGRRMVSTDVYPLMIRGDDAVLDGSWLTNLYLLRELADETNSDFNMFIQSVGYVQHRKPESGKEIRFQVWTDLCFGITAYTYFTYAGEASSDSWKYTDPVVAKDGSPYDIDYYNGCKAVNTEVTKLAPVYRSFDWEGVLVSNGTETSREEVDAGLFNLNQYSLSEVDFLTSYTAQYGTVYGIYGAEDGGNAMVVTNYTDPILNRSNTVQLVFSDADTALVYRQGEWEYNRLVGGEFEITLESGEGIFLIPCKLS